MNKTPHLLTLLAWLFAISFSTPVALAGPLFAPPEAISELAGLSSAHVCAAAPLAGHVTCHAQVVLDTDGQPFTSSDPHGYYPGDIDSAYNLPAGGGEGLTVAVVDAFDDPNAESDLAIYRSHFGLPPCTTVNGCFRKVNQDGADTPLPVADDSWSQEISLDLDAVSAACPACSILLIEARSDAMSDLGPGVNSAARLGAAAISNSYGGAEAPGDAVADARYYQHPGVLITASTGDNAYGVQYPATSSQVLAIGGTSLLHVYSPRGWGETAWALGGSGCSAYVAKPSYQHDKNCANRTIADVSAVADPLTGLAIYDSYGSGKGWEVYGGTSLSSPLVAAFFARIGAAGEAAGFPYANPSAFYDVNIGVNGVCLNDLCTAGNGYDGPTGIGTPNAAAIIGIISGSGATGAGGKPHCSAGSTDVLGICVPDNIGCQSTGSGGAFDWIVCAIFGLVATARARRRRVT